MSRRMIKEVHDFYEYHLTGTIDEVMANLDELKSRFGGAARIDAGYEGEWTIYAERLETDAEYEKRMARAEKRKEAAVKAAATRKANADLIAKVAAAQEKKLYQQLKAKYEGK